jgi:cell division protein FtsQ
VRASAGVAPQRFRDIFPVESDLARRNERAAELDIRYRDQVVARLE